MAFEEGTDELTCPACGACHTARWSRMPIRDHSTVTCQVCNGVIFSGKGVRDYHSAELIAGT